MDEWSYQKGSLVHCVLAKESCGLVLWTGSKIAKNRVLVAGEGKH